MECATMCPYRTCHDLYTGRQDCLVRLPSNPYRGCFCPYPLYANRNNNCVLATNCTLTDKNAPKPRPILLG